MTTDEIVANLDRSLAAIASEREQLLSARAQLAGNPSPTPPRPQRQARPRRLAVRRRRANTMGVVLEALDASEARTASDVDRLTGVGRTVAGSTLSRLVKQGLAAKADRGYLRAAG